ncbi:MAG: hypothetical protein ABGX07_12110 [Pirellulaceae bacterium]
MTDETVGGLSVDGAEVRFAIDNRRLNGFMFGAGSQLGKLRRTVSGGMVMISELRTRGALGH